MKLLDLFQRIHDYLDERFEPIPEKGNVDVYFEYDSPDNRLLEPPPGN